MKFDGRVHAALSTILLSQFVCMSGALAEQQCEVEMRNTPANVHLRAICVANDGSVWACGGNQVVRSSDRGTTWKLVAPQQFDALEFRALHAWDSETAVIASAGSPALVLRTEDGGDNWSEVVRYGHPAAFFDGMQFPTDRNGYVFGDPVGGRVVCLKSNDRGRNWVSQSGDRMPLADAGEAGFAASNGALATFGADNIWIGLGGSTEGASRVLSSLDAGYSWSVFTVPPIKRGPSSGIFAITFRDEENGVAVGGDYRQEDLGEANIAITRNGGRDWGPAEGRSPRGFRSAVIFSEKFGFLTAGPSGMETSAEGNDWSPVSDTGFHALTLGSEGEAWACGSAGRVARIRFH